jgi:hypothetical protein
MFCVAKATLSSLKGAGKTTELGIWTFLLVMAAECSTACHCESDEIFILFVNDKFTGDRQPFVQPDFTFLSTKIMLYFSYVIRKVPRPDSFTKIKFPRATSPAAKLRHQHLHFLSTHCRMFFITQSCMWDPLKLLYRAVNTNQLLLHSFLLKCFPTIFFLYPLRLLGFQLQFPLVFLSVSILLFTRFLPPVFLGPALGRVYYFQEHFHKCSLSFFFIFILIA